MPTYTSRLQLPRPTLDEPADGPDGFNDLTDVLDPVVATYAAGTTGARPPAGVPGRFYWNTDTNTLFYDDGTAWMAGTGATAVAAAMPVGDVGMVGQIRAGRQLTVADFTAMGLAQPIGLWNLSGLTNLGSDGRALANKGAVPFGVGINGLASTAAVFAGSTSQALYIADSGAADPFRIKTGSWGCWFRTAKRGVSQGVMTKATAGAAADLAFQLYVVSTSNVLVCDTSTGAVVVPLSGVSDVADDRWHFGVGTHDGATVRVYVDGVLEGTASAAGPMSGGTGPLNIGGRGADAGTAAGLAHYGRVDEAFVTADVLTEDQIRNLYCAKLAHGLPVTPSRVSLNVTRRRRGGAFVVADFPTQPVRLHNFTAGALTDQGSGNVTLTNNGTAVSVAGADGTPGGAFSFAGAQSLSATDAGLPAFGNARSYGCWFKTTSTTSMNIMGWGTIGTADARLTSLTSGLTAYSGADSITAGFVADGQWHFAVVVEHFEAGDGVRRKLYLDGRLVGGSTAMNSLTLAGANRVRVGANPDGTAFFTGQIDGAFICSDALTAAHVAALYAKGSEALPPSPKEAGAHVEALQATDVLCVFDTLDSTALVDLGVTS